MAQPWKENWKDTKQQFADWWGRKGLIVGMWGDPPRTAPHAKVPDPGLPRDFDQAYLGRHAPRLHEHCVEQLSLGAHIGVLYCLNCPVV